ncbi:MAG: hypothetical protein M3014_11420 [Chloroflexota bacterium]|nr:hypothetical protein [Chloroflexota bacterium]
MASSMTMAGSLASAEEATLKGVRRSRLSFHFSTPRVRRWLLVQLVSVPAREQVPAKRAGIEAYLPAQLVAHEALGSTLDSYMLTQAMRRGF